MYNILIVDDEILVRAWLKKCVNWEKFGFVVKADVSDGQTALDVIKNEKIDLIITDIRMPIMDGITLIKHVRKFDERVRVLILTCLDEFSLVSEAFKLNVSNYILKLTSEPDEIEKELSGISLYLKSFDSGNRAAALDTDKDNRQNSISNVRLYAAVRFLEEHFAENIGISDVADEVGITPNYLGTLFQQEFNCSMTEKLNRLRINEAKRLLDIPSNRVNEIAALVGFSNSSYFFRQFKKFEDCTPTEYRRRRNIRVHEQV